MTQLKKLLHEACPDIQTTDGVPDIAISGVECDSRQVKPGFVFVAIPGVKKDGSVFIEEAVKNGAVCVVSEKEEAIKTPQVHVSDARLAVARLAHVFYGKPTAQMKVIGITGTNGKTTSSYLIEHLLKEAGKNPGVLGTINYRYSGHVIPAVETTPGPLKLQRIFRKMADAGCDYAVMEVSSHALHQSRVEGIQFETALFTNLTQDHLDYHKTFENYFECKSRLFKGLAQNKISVINVDGEWGRKLKGMVSRAVTYGIDAAADLKASNVRYGTSETVFDLLFKGNHRVQYPLVGSHNVYNVLGALGIISALGLDVALACRALKNFPGVPGRLEAVQAGQDFSVFVDFAHTPDGLENVLTCLERCKKSKLFVVFGCGGDRDPDKRPKMGAIAAKHCDHVFITSDNPRSEDAKKIAEQIKAGLPPDFKNYTVVIDRKKAIRQALMKARASDIVVLAGKGHESSQIIGEQVLPFSDKEEALYVLQGH